MPTTWFYLYVSLLAGRRCLPYHSGRMSLEIRSRRETLPEGLLRFETLRGFRGETADFWRAFLNLLAPIIRAESITVLTPPASGQPWLEIASKPTDSGLFHDLLSEGDELEQLFLGCGRHGSAISTFTTDSGATHPIVAVRWQLGTATTLAVGLLEEGASMAEAVTCLHLVGGEPLLFQLAQSQHHSSTEATRKAAALALLTRLHAEPGFASSAKAVCDEISLSHRAARCSLGWRRGHHTRLRATSEVSAIDREAEANAPLEAAMDEALDQSLAIVWPPAQSTAICRNHGAFARRQGADAVISIPFLSGGRALGVLTLERAGGSFTPQEVEELQSLCDLIAPRLAELQRRSRWLGAQLATAVADRLLDLAGGRRPLVRFGWVAAALALFWLLFGKLEYRVEAPFILRSSLVAQLPAPFDGYLDEVFVRPGDAVHAGQTLAALDSRELLLKEAAALAEHQRLLAEAQKAEGENNVADMRIAQAAVAEAQARLDLVRYQLAQVKITASFDGYVVEGDLRDRIFAPVRKGEVLFKVAALSPLFIEMAAPERDIHDLRAGQSGQVMFLGRPEPSFAVRTAAAEPVAQVHQNGNVFMVRGELVAAPAEWLRPGMSGICSVSVGRRRLLWIVGHRSLDFIRMYLWR
jgi:multidrug efflux pump subunit AcrA (membrane-fusion protein)